MYDRRFFTSNVGLSALASIAAMVTFNAYALSQQLEPATSLVTAASTAARVELA